MKSLTSSSSKSKHPSQYQSADYSNLARSSTVIHLTWMQSTKQSSHNMAYVCASLDWKSASVIWRLQTWQKLNSASNKHPSHYQSANYSNLARSSTVIHLTWMQSSSQYSQNMAYVCASLDWKSASVIWCLQTWQKLESSRGSLFSGTAKTTDPRFISEILLLQSGQMSSKSVTQVLMHSKQ